MKKFLFFSAVVASALTLASCSSDDAPEMTPQKGVTFTVNLPADLQTRGDFGDGTKATSLYYAVYDAKATTPAPLALIDDTDKTVGKTNFTNLKATVHLNLPKGPQYNIVFFACTDAENPEDNVYEFDADKAKFIVHYNKMNTNGYSEKNDCFTTTRANFKLSGPVTETITLYRPVAQLNIGASDYKQATAGTLNTAFTQVEINRLYSEFSFISGTLSEDGKCDMGAVTGEEAPFKFDMTAIPGDDEVFPYKPEGAEATPYTYMSMNYVLVPTTKTIHNVSFGIDDDRYETAVFSNVPMQRNHRTNIFGDIFTSPADFDVVIDPRFDTPDYNIHYGIEEVSTPGELAEALTHDNVKIILKNDILQTSTPILNVTGKNIVIEGRESNEQTNKQIKLGQSYFNIAGSCESFKINNVDIELATGQNQSMFYVKEQGTRTFSMTNCSLNNWGYETVQMTSPTLKNITLDNNQYNPGRKCHRAIHIEIRTPEGQYMYPAADINVSICGNYFITPNWFEEEILGLYNVNVDGITFEGNAVLGNSNRPLIDLFNIWNYNPDVAGSWEKYNDRFISGVN